MSRLVAQLLDRLSASWQLCGDQRQGTLLAPCGGGARVPGGAGWQTSGKGGVPVGQRGSQPLGSMLPAVCKAVWVPSVQAPLGPAQLCTGSGYPTWDHGRPA